MKNNGFTLIELVMIIVILAILAVVAVPKYVDLRRDANIAVLSGAQGSVSSAMHMIYAKAIVEGKEKDASNTINVGGLPITIFYGYPQDNAITFVAGLDSNFNRISVGADNHIILDGDFSCKFHYLEATSASTAARVYRTDPADITGC